MEAGNAGVGREPPLVGLLPLLEPPAQATGAEDSGAAPGPAFQPDAAALALAAAVFGWGALVAANFAGYREAVASRGASVFLIARLRADADAPRILRPHCDAGAGLAICRQLDRLAADRPAVDGFLWDFGGTALLPDLGWVPGFYLEAREPNAILLPEAWKDWPAASVRRAASQLAGHRLGDGMDRGGLGVLPEALPGQGPPSAAAAIAATRQAADGLAPLMPRGLAEGLAAAGLLALSGLFVRGLARGRPEVWWPALLFLAAWAGDAAPVALAGEVHGRCGARLVLWRRCSRACSPCAQPPPAKREPRAA